MMTLLCVSVRYDAIKKQEEAVGNILMVYNAAASASSAVASTARFLTRS